MSIATKIEIFLVEDFDEIKETFKFCLSNVPQGYEMDDFQVTEFSAGYLIKAIIKEQKGSWVIE
jgi:hypothetical protein